MADGEQERFEDYLELERYIEALQAGEIAHPPADLTPEQARIYQMAALFRSMASEQAEPRPAFVKDLRAQLLALSELPPLPISERATMPHEIVHPPAPALPEPPAVPNKTVKPLRFFSRRGLLTGGSVAAASFVMGVAIEHLREPAYVPVNDPTDSQTLEITTKATWHFVTPLADLGSDAVRFVSDAIVGYVMRATRDAANQTGQESVIAFSAACTHMGCLVKWEGSERQFYCPCHGASFDESGAQVYGNYAYNLQPLPRLKTKIEDGRIYVEVPQSGA